jgi:hypothetical protein
VRNLNFKSVANDFLQAYFAERCVSITSQGSLSVSAAEKLIRLNEAFNILNDFLFAFLSGLNQYRNDYERCAPFSKVLCFFRDVVLGKDSKKREAIDC